MYYRHIMIAIAVLIVCAVCASALSISTTTVRTEDGEMQSTTSTSSRSTGSETMSLGEDVGEEEIVALYEEDVSEEDSTEENAEFFSEGVANNCIEGYGNELIIRFEPEYFERLDGTLDEAAMEEAELRIHASIKASVLSDLAELGMPGLQLVGLPEGMSLEEGIAYYEALPEVRFAEPNYQISIYPAEECAEGETTDEITDEPGSEEAEALDEITTSESQVSTTTFSF